MSESETQPETTRQPAIVVAPSPHVSSPALKTQRMMLDVLLALVPCLIASLVMFREHAALRILVCIGSCVVAEGVFTLMRRRKLTLTDCSAVVTGVILAMSLPWSIPLWVCAIGAVVAIGISKAIFGGLGQNLFNPAMVGRAFVMICFAGFFSANAYYTSAGQAGLPAAITEATPLSAAREAANQAAESGQPQAPPAITLQALFMGNVNGSLGETSALACILGGLYLSIRRTASWRIPVSMILAVVVIGGIVNLAGDSPFTVLHHVLGGSLLFGAVFIATDPVTSPMTSVGKCIFGAGTGALVVLIRHLSSYPEGVMFAVLLMNALVPLINRWTIPKPVGGPVPEPA